MPKNISRAIAKRILEVEAQVIDEIDLTAVKADYHDCFLTLHDKLDIASRDILVKMDGSTDTMLFLAIRKAYYAGLQDGMSLGGVL